MARKTYYPLIASGLLVGMAASPVFAATPFDGPYVGAQVGHSVHDIEATTNVPATSETAVIDGISASGAEGGLYAGWGMKFNPTTYGGLEGEYSWSAEEHTTTLADPTGTGTLKVEEKYNYGIGARLGWLPTSTTMLYVRAGWQRVNMDYSASAYGLSGTENRDHDGVRLGFGAEVAVTNDWLVRVDYAHTRYDDETLPPGSAGETLKFEPVHNVFRVGIARQF